MAFPSTWRTWCTWRMLSLSGALCLAACGNDVQPLPCDVDQVFEDKCRLCHNVDLDFGAPMTLDTWNDLHAPAPFASTVKVWQEVERRTHQEAFPMPPIGLPSLNFDEHEILDQWFEAGAPAGQGSCAE